MDPEPGTGSVTLLASSASAGQSSEKEGQNRERRYTTYPDGTIGWDLKPAEMREAINEYF